MILNLTAMFRSSAQFLLQIVVFGTATFLLLYARLPAARIRAAAQSPQAPPI